MHTFNNKMNAEYIEYFISFACEIWSNIKILRIDIKLSDV